MIDQRTGSIELLGGEVKPFLKLSNFLETELGRRAKKGLEHGEWLNYDARIGDSLNAVFVFKDGALVEARLSKRSPEESSWATWSEAEESRRKAAHDDLLKQELGNPPYRFLWGVVESVLDQKGGGSQIIVRYRG